MPNLLIKDKLEKKNCKRHRHRKSMLVNETTPGDESSLPSTELTFTDLTSVSVDIRLRQQKTSAAQFGALEEGDPPCHMTIYVPSSDPTLSIVFTWVNFFQAIGKVLLRKFR